MATISWLYLLPITGIIISLILFFTVGGQQRGLLFGQGNGPEVEIPVTINYTNSTIIETAVNSSLPSPTPSSSPSPASPAPLTLAVNDSSLEIQTVYQGLDSPTQMAFLGPDDILVLQKNDGKLLRIKDCNPEPEVLLNVNVTHNHERGLLGIAISKTQEQKTNVFIYYTQTRSGDGQPNPGFTENLLYRYELTTDGKLVNPKLIFKVDANQGASHNGGVMTIGPDNNLYLVIGDIAGHKTLTQNYLDGTVSEGSSTILRFTQEGESAGAILGIVEPLNKFYAYGIRNSFGMDFDLVTGKLWDTENGPEKNDEINLVEPGFNSGWAKIIGFPSDSSFDPEKSLVNCLYCNANAPPSLDIGIFVNKYLNGMKEGRYSDPEFVWTTPVGVTAIKFLNSDKLGKNYENDMFVADILHGAIYHFELNENRDGLVLEGALMDRIADSSEELPLITFAEGFGGITDLEVGPDGYLYILSYTGYSASTDEEAIYRIVPKGTPQPC